MADDIQLRSKLARVEELIHEAEKLPDEALRNQAQELVQNLLDFPPAPKLNLLGKLDKNKATEQELLEAESAAYHSAGTCTFYGTANSNQMLMESRIV